MSGVWVACVCVCVLEYVQLALTGCRDAKESADMKIGKKNDTMVIESRIGGPCWCPGHNGGRGDSPTLPATSGLRKYSSYFLLPPPLTHTHTHHKQATLVSNTSEVFVFQQ